ncbi:LexA family protein [Lichenihabitans psoromatis]|uniref:LexA family protein n=1 Tax=Lichenihabitans psoromatis TaxID=2528642 RepID=UPI001036CEC1|nr:S24 family peptidase [Lichenihabitans psoromatis]
MIAPIDTGFGNTTVKVNGYLTSSAKQEERSYYRSMELSEILARIERRLEKLGLSAASASKAAGKTDAIRNLQRAVESGDKRQGISTATLNALAPILKTSSIWLLAGAGPESIDNPDEIENDAARDYGSRTSDLVLAQYAGIVEAGSFRPVDEDINYDVEPIPVPRDRKYPHAKLFFFDVAGDSMNDLKPRPIMPGDQALCIEIEKLRVPYRHGMVVVVEQIINGGHLRERSVKQIELFEDRVEFCPRSRNPKHKPIVVPREPTADDGRIVAVIAIVRSIVNTISSD